MEMQTRLADVLELRAADPQQRVMLNAYLSELQLPSLRSHWKLAVERER